MKKILMAAVALTAISATPAMAAAPGASFTVSGTVGQSCSYTGGTIAFGAIATDAATGLIVASQSASSSGQAAFYCNGAGTTVELSHAALSTGSTAPTGFVSSIDFTPVVKVNDVALVTGDTASGTAFGAQSGSLVVTAKDLTATGKLQAGTYNGTISLTLTPAA